MSRYLRALCACGQSLWPLSHPSDQRPFMRTSLQRKPLCWLFTLAALSACQDDLQPTAPTPEAPAAQASATGEAHGRGLERSAEAHGRRLAQQVPDFGGWYFDIKGDLNVWVKNSDVHGARARAAVAQVADEVGLIPARPGYNIIIRQGRYSWQELSDWRDRIEALADGIEGIRWVDLDERINRVAVGVNSGRARAEARKQAAEVGIPRGAISIQMEECEPYAIDCNDPCSLDPYADGCQDPCSLDPSDPNCTTDPCETNPEDPSCEPPADSEEMWDGGELNAPMSYEAAGENLDSEFNRLRGGIRIRNLTRYGDNSCSLGAVAYSPTYGSVFVTNSHCTYDQGGVDYDGPREFYQHYISQPLWVGSEVQDPPYYKPADYCSSWWNNTVRTVCRYPVRNSDAAVIKIENRASDRGIIARPANRKLEGQGAGTLQIDPSRPVLRIARDQVTTSISVTTGNRLDKIGATTGWTSGTVQSVCRTEYQTSPNRRRHTCQNRVDYTNSSGDSGAPVFYLANDNEVWLLGFHHMKVGVYSPLTQVAKDLPGLVYR